MEITDLKFDSLGLIPAVVQDDSSGKVLMVAYVNEESLRRTLLSGETHFWSRSRQALWHKGETSGNTQRVVSIRADCDQDALLIRVEPAGPACHTGKFSCFNDESILGNAGTGKETGAGIAGPHGLEKFLARLYRLIESRKRERPEGSYTTYLFEKGLDKILKKVGEESAETIIAAKNESAEGLTAEIADLVYHLLVLMVERGISLASLASELETRAGKLKGPKKGTE